MRTFDGNRATPLDIRDEYDLCLLACYKDIHIRREAAGGDLVASMIEETIAIATSSRKRPRKLIGTGIGDIEGDPSLLCWKTRGKINAGWIDL